MIDKLIGKGLTKTFLGNILYNTYLKFKPSYIKLFGYKFYIPRCRDIISDKLVLFKSFEPNQTEITKELIKEGDTVIDIGANIGYYTLLFSRLVGKTGKVYSFEPDKNNFEILEKNIKENKISNVKYYNVALNSYDGTVNFNIHPVNNGGHSIENINGSRGSVIVDCFKLDTIIKDENIKLIKIDVEGAERKVLTGASKILSNNKCIIIGEYTDGNNKYEDLLENNSYILFDGYDNVIKRVSSVLLS